VDGEYDEYGEYDDYGEYEEYGEYNAATNPLATPVSYPADEDWKLKNLLSNATMERDWIYQYTDYKVQARGSKIEDRNI